MVSLKWGDALSTLLPGAVVLLALAPYFPMLNAQLGALNSLGFVSGVALLIAAALAGGLLEATTRIGWEKWLVKRWPLPESLSKLTPQNVELYERGVQSSYKYVTFYANLATATLVLLISRLHHGGRILSVANLAVLVAIPILLRASHVQWKYYVNYQTKVFGEKAHVEERPASGNESEIHAHGSEGQNK